MKIAQNALLIHSCHSTQPAVGCLEMRQMSEKGCLPAACAAALCKGADPSQLMTKEVDALDQWLQVNAGDWTTGRKSTTECKYRKKLDELVVQQPDGTVGLSIRFRTAAEEMAVQVLKKVSDLAEALAQQLQEFTSETSRASAALQQGPGREAGKIRFKEDEIPISGMHIVKLRQLYEVHNGSQISEEVYRHRMYCMLRRYVTFIGLDPAQQGSQGGNMHAAAPESVFAWLRDHMGVSCELFASPLNCYFAQYYSAFPDVDAFFGSRGSFFDVADLPEGSYEVGPPYTEEVRAVRFCQSCPSPAFSSSSSRLLLLPPPPPPASSSSASSRSQWALPDFICQLQIAVGTAGLHLPAPDRSGHCRTSSASSRSQWALPDFSCDCQISVRAAGLQPRAPDPSGHCRTSAATARSQRALPDFSRDCQISVGTAGLQPRAPDGSGHCRTSAALQISNRTPN
eukprot:s354_g12.t1